MKIAVTDANIFIDLIWLNQLAGLFELEVEIVTPQEVLEELLQNHIDAIQPFIDANYLTVYHLPESAFVEIDQWLLSNRLSFPDKVALYLAKQLGAIVLTGDNLLRKQAIANQMEAHGLLWILEQWVFHGIVTPKEASIMLQQLRQFNERLPQKECEDLLERWNRPT